MIFYIVGTWAFEIPLLAKSGFIPIWLVFIGWGLNQVSLSVFIQNFIKSTRTATISGYILALTALLVAFYANVY